MDRKRKHGSPDTSLSLRPIPPSSPSSSLSNVPQLHVPPTIQTTFTEPLSREYQSTISTVHHQNPSNYIPPSPEAVGQTPSTELTLQHPPTTSTTALPQRQVPLPHPSNSTGVAGRQDPSASNVVVAQQAPPPRRRTTRTRHKSTQAPRVVKDIHVPPPFQWATNLRATVRSLNDLRSLGILTIQGEVQCKRCEGRYEIGFDLNTQFQEISQYIINNMDDMYARAPKEWMNPRLPDCRVCHQTDCMKPVISPKKRSINWLFLFLGKMIGCCTINQLKYFCKHTRIHRTGAKDRVLYSTYVSLCKQLDPNVFD
ncbi:uncharacterized protein LOC131228934 [Magnolia sinica]|uniref:uncharacterized protein LOC131228934 n=1 Tax=Magnolia sinica TaxID=86752 RepID=UPI002658A9A7|nr:uncharacterized protein LOC131228934 [Magnolia sinica]